MRRNKDGVTGGSFIARGGSSSPRLCISRTGAAGAPCSGRTRPGRPASPKVAEEDRQTDRGAMRGAHSRAQKKRSEALVTDRPEHFLGLVWTADYLCQRSHAFNNPEWKRTRKVPEPTFSWPGPRLLSELFSILWELKIG